MPRQRLTRETLASVSELAGAREHVRLAESILGPSATDNEILATAKRLSHLSPNEVRVINQSRQTIQRQNQRIASPNGAEDPWDESGPDQPDPTNNQAYTKQIITSPDHAVLDSLQKKDIHAPTASRKARELSREARQKYRLAAEDEDEGEVPDIEDDHLNDLDDRTEDYEDMEDPGELGEEHLLEEIHEDVQDIRDVLEDEMGDAEFGDGGMGDAEFGDEEMGDFEGGEEEALDLDEDKGDLDEMLDMEDRELDDDEGLGEPDIFDGVDDLDDVEEDGVGMGAPPSAPMSNRQSRPASRQAGRGRRMVSGRQPQDRRLRTGAGGGSGPARMSLDEILDVHDEDIERTASTALEGDDLEALLGARVDRAGRRVATTKSAERESPAAQHRRAMVESIWDTENDPELIQARGGQATARKRPGSAPQQQQQPRRRQAARRGKPVQQKFAPDRRRTPQRSTENEFDQVFGVDGMPDVSKFFD